MFERFNGNVVPFADESTSTNRTVFGSETQSDDIDDNLNADFKKGWEIVGLNDNPTREDFNAMGYTLGYLTSYLYQNGVAEYNLLQEYKTNSIAIGADGNIYQSLVDNNLGNALTDTTKWVCIASKNSIVNSIDELKTISNIESINVLGYYEKGDGGGGVFYWDSTSTETDNGGTIIQATGVTTGRWKRVFSGAVNVKWFGYTNKKIIDYVAKKSNVHILAYGDSITWGKKPNGTQATDRYPVTLLNLLETAFNYSGVTITEKGFPGRQSGTALINFSSDVVAYNPDFVLIMFGINDSRDYDGVTYNVVSIEQYKNNLRAMCLKSFQNDIIPILLTPTPTIEKNEQQELLAYYNACIDVANEIGVDYIDTRKPFDSFLKSSSLNIEDIMDDYIHMTRYDWLGNAVFESIINSDTLRFSEQKINSFNQLYISGDNLTFSELGTGKNCVILNKNGTNGNYLKSTFFIQEPNMDLFIHTAEAVNTLQSYVIKIDDVDYSMTGKQVYDSVSYFKDLIVSNLSVGIHTLEINISDFISNNANDVLVLLGFETKKNNNLISSLLYSGEPYLSKQSLIYETIGNGNFTLEAQLSSGTSVIESILNQKEIFLNEDYNLLTVYCDFKCSGARGGLSFLANETSGGYYIYFTESNILLLKRESANIVSSSYETLDSESFTYVPNATHAIKIIYDRSGTCNVYIDNVLKLAASNLDFMSGFFGSILGANTSSRICEISNFRYSLSKL